MRNEAQTGKGVVSLFEQSKGPYKKNSTFPIFLSFEFFLGEMRDD